MLGLAPDFGILDSEDAKTLLAAVIAERGPKELTARRFPQPGVLHGLLGLACGLRRPLQQILVERAPKFADLGPALQEIADDFAARKHKMNVQDFDDLLVSWHRLLTDAEFTASRERLVLARQKLAASNAAADPPTAQE